MLNAEVMNVVDRPWLREVHVDHNHVLTVIVTCWKCKKESDVEVDFTSFQIWKDGKEMLHTALPQLGIDTREMFISGTCSTCWDVLFAETE